MLIYDSRTSFFFAKRPSDVNLYIPNSKILFLHKHLSPIVISVEYPIFGSRGIIIFFLSQILDFRGAKHDCAAACYHIDVIAYFGDRLLYALHHILFTQFLCVVLNGSKKFTPREAMFIHTDQKTTMTTARLKIAVAAVVRRDIIGPTLFPFSVYIVCYTIIIYTVYAYIPVEGAFYFGANLRRSIGLICRMVVV